MVRKRKKTVFEISRSERLKRILYKAAINVLITIAIAIAAHIWMMHITKGITNKWLERYQAPKENKNINLSTERETEDIKQQQLAIINQRKQESIANARREAEIRKVVEAEQKLERFKAQYKKPEKCYNVTDNETRVYCANDYIRARKAFELKQANLANQ